MGRAARAAAMTWTSGRLCASAWDAIRSCATILQALQRRSLSLRCCSCASGKGCAMIQHGASLPWLCTSSRRPVTLAKQDQRCIFLPI